MLQTQLLEISITLVTFNTYSIFVPIARTHWSKDLFTRYERIHGKYFSYIREQTISRFLLLIKKETARCKGDLFIYAYINVYFCFNDDNIKLKNNRVKRKKIEREEKPHGDERIYEKTLLADWKWHGWLIQVNKSMWGKIK